MNERIRLLWEEAAKTTQGDSWEEQTKFIERFAELIVRECIKTINFECKDFANGNCFNDVKLWESVTREYGSNKERDFDPVGMGIHFENKLKQHFGVE